MENRYISLQQHSSGATRYVDELNSAGQVDLDSNGEPFVISYEDVAGEQTLIRVFIKRNNTKQNFVINKRSRTGSPKRASFDTDDGWKRDDSAKPETIDEKPKPKSSAKPNQERSRRAGLNFETVIKTLLKRDKR